MTEQLRFGFGKNWQSFVSSEFSTARLVRAAQSLRDLLGVEHLAGRTMLDIGCGSGLFSLAALMLGAKQVFSFDYDPDSVAACQSLQRQTMVDSQRWQIMQGSVLDPAFMASLPMTDLVYSWGVLHHTGSMWDAISQAAAKVLPGGVFAIAIYHRVERLLNSSQMWASIKRTYNQSPLFVRRVIEIAYAGMLLTQVAMRGGSPVGYVRNYSAISQRGMHFWHDVRDWVGGYPYEYAAPAELASHCSRLGLTLVNLRHSDGLGCNELVFHRL
jgi:SAM-dependent methyltransferase